VSVAAVRGRPSTILGKMAPEMSKRAPKVCQMAPETGSDGIGSQTGAFAPTFLGKMASKMSKMAPKLDPFGRFLATGSDFVRSP